MNSVIIVNFVVVIIDVFYNNYSTSLSRIQMENLRT